MTLKRICLLLFLLLIFLSCNAARITVKGVRGKGFFLLSNFLSFRLLCLSLFSDVPTPNVSKIATKVYGHTSFLSASSNDGGISASSLASPMAVFVHRGYG